MVNTGVPSLSPDAPIPPKGMLAFVADQADLRAALSHVQRASNNQTVLPVLSYVLLASDGGRLRLSTTNLQVSLTAWIKANILTEGSICVPAETFVDWVDAVRGENKSAEVKLETEKKLNKVKLTCGGVNSKIKGLDAEEFPLLALGDVSKALALDAAAFSRAISRVSGAASRNTARPYLTGVLVHQTEDSVSLACSDGYRLALSTLPVKSATAIGRLIIPAKWITEVAKIAPAKGDNKDAPLYLDASHPGVAVFHCGDSEVAIQLLEGDYPQYETLIPTAHTTRMICEVDGLRKMIQTVDVFAREVSHGAYLEIKPGDETTPGVLEIHSTVEIGDGDISGEVVVEGVGVQLAANLDYLLDGLRGIETPQVSLECNSGYQPCVLRPVGATDFLYLVMPIVKEQIGQPEPA